MIRESEKDREREIESCVREIGLSCERERERERERKIFKVVQDLTF